MSNKELSLTLRLNIDPALDGQLDSLLTAVAAAVTPLDGYEHVDQQWWQPCTGCDWLDRTLDAIRTRLAAAVTEWYRSALAASPATDGPAVPPVEGEAGKLAEWLLAEADLRRNVLSTPTGLNLAQAARQADKLQAWATLLQQQSTELAELRSMATPPPVEGEAGELPANYIDPEHQGDDRELLRTFYQACNAEGGTADEIHLRGLRAVLATRPAAPPAPVPAEGEVGELVEFLFTYGDHVMDEHGDLAEHDLLTRAAALLQSQATELAAWRSLATLVPVPVGERPWERQFGWRDLDGECWWCPPDGPPQWTMANPAMVYGGWLLPSWAIPQLPQEGGEVEG